MTNKSGLTFFLSKKYLSVCLLYFCHKYNARVTGNVRMLLDKLQLNAKSTMHAIKGVVNCQNSQDEGPPEGNSARG